MVVSLECLEGTGVNIGRNTAQVSLKLGLQCLSLNEEAKYEIS